MVFFFSLSETKAQESSRIVVSCLSIASRLLVTEICRRVEASRTSSVLRHPLDFQPTQSRRSIALAAGRTARGTELNGPAKAPAWTGGRALHALSSIISTVANP